MDDLRKEVDDEIGDVHNSIETTRAALEVQIDGISSEVTRQEEDMGSIKSDLTTLQQSANGLEIRVQNIVDNGVDKVTTNKGYTFDDDGLHITADGEISNSLDETGMYVVRSKGSSAETVMLQANADGVIATDVTVRNYLIIGTHARFEDYSNGSDNARTACFFI